MSEHAPPQSQFELAGALQGTLLDIERRDFSLDIQQETALEQIGRHLLDGQKSGYVEMATGTGKTTIEALVAEAAVKSGKRVLMLAPKKAIAQQISGKSQEKPTGLTRFTSLHETSTIGHHFGNSRAKNTDQVVISTYSGLLNTLETGELGNFDVVIADECHRSLGAKTSAAMKGAFPDALKLGFSATPDYATDRQADEVFDNKIFEFSLIDAIESGKTAPLRTLIYETDQPLTLSDHRAEFTEKELAPLINNIERNGTAYQLAIDLVKDGRQGIIACIPGSTNVHARMMAQMLSSASGKVLAADVGAHLSDEENAFRLKAFQEGDIHVLTFTRALEEGWDSDQASFCINMAPTASPVRTKQLMGRVLRKNPDSKESLYVDFIDNKEGVTKHQYTAMHALQLDTIDFNRILGHREPSSQWRAPSPLLLPNISDSLLQHIIHSQGRLIDEVGITKKEKADPLMLHWEGILTKEGMPAELEYNDVLPATLNRRIEKALVDFIAEHDREPASASELIDTMGGIDKSRKHAMGYYGIRTSTALIDEDKSDIDSDQNPYKIIAEEPFEEQLHAVLDTLSEREAGIIAMRFGLTGNEEPKDLDGVGKVYRITRERVRQLESKTMLKLRHPSRSQVLKAYMDKDYSSTYPNHIPDRIDARIEPIFSRENKYRQIFKGFVPIEMPPPLVLQQFILPDDHHERIRERYPWYKPDDDRYKDVFNWKSVKAARERFGINKPSNKDFDDEASLLQSAITEIGDRILYLQNRPVADSKSSQQQRKATLKVYQSRLAYLSEQLRQLNELRTFLIEQGKKLW